MEAACTYKDDEQHSKRPIWDKAEEAALEDRLWDSTKSRLHRAKKSTLEHINLRAELIQNPANRRYVEVVIDWAVHDLTESHFVDFGA